MKLDAPLDMRMDPGITATAAAVVNGYAEADLADLIWRFGEERYSRRIARFIVEERSRKRIETTGGFPRSFIGRWGAATGKSADRSLDTDVPGDQDRGK